MLKRKKQPMPEFVLKVLQVADAVEAFNARPEYQRNDYLVWINNAKQMDTKQKRMAQMIDELKRGGIYVKMEHPASRKN